MLDGLGIHTGVDWRGWPRRATGSRPFSGVPAGRRWPAHWQASVISRILLPGRVIPLLAVLALAIALLPPPAGASVATMHAGALAFFTIGLWATGAMPEHVTALLFMTLAVLLKVAPPGVAFAGFEATAMWLVFGGLIIGTVMQRTGLGERLAVAILPLFGASYTRALAGWRRSPWRSPSSCPRPWGGSCC